MCFNPGKYGKQFCEYTENENENETFHFIVNHMR